MGIDDAKGALLTFNLISSPYTNNFHFSSYLAHLPSITVARKGPSHRTRKWIASLMHAFLSFMFCVTDLFAELELESLRGRYGKRAMS